MKNSNFKAFLAITTLATIFCTSCGKETVTAPVQETTIPVTIENSATTEEAESTRELVIAENDTTDSKSVADPQTETESNSAETGTLDSETGTQTNETGEQKNETSAAPSNRDTSAGTELSAPDDSAKQTEVATATAVPTKSVTQSPAKSSANTPKATPTSAPKAKATATPKPTSTPKPTAIPTKKATATPTKKPTSTPKPTATPTPYVMVNPTSDRGGETYESKNELFVAINKWRAEQGVDTLKTNDFLMEAAQIRLQEQYVTGLSHVRPDDTMCFTVLGDYGTMVEYWCYWSENCAFDNTPASSKAKKAAMFVEDWAESDGHRENMEYEYFDLMGVAFDDNYAVVIFAESQEMGWKMWEEQ